MGSHESGHHIHRMVFIEFFQDLQHLDFRFEVQTVAALGFAGGHAQSHHLIQKAFCLIIQLLKAGSAGLSHRIQNAAAGPENVQIPCTLQLQRNFILPISSENHMGVSFHQPRCYQISLRIQNQVRRSFAAGKFPVRTDFAKNSVFDQNRGAM